MRPPVACSATPKPRLQALLPPMTIEGRSLSVRASIGLAVYPRDGDEMAALLNKADQAMYQAKREHGGYALVAEEWTSLPAAHLVPTPA